MTESAAVPPPRVLVVEDDVLLQRLLVRVLTDAGYGAVAVPNGMAALALLERDPGAIDLVVTGIARPILDGLELYRMLRRLGLRVPVLFVSGFVELEVAQELARDPGAHFLAKPWTLDDLQATVREILDRGARQVRAADPGTPLFPRPERRGRPPTE